MSAVLLSGGLDSAVLLAEEAQRGPVQPIYVNVGLAWEQAERAAVTHFLKRAPLHEGALPLVSLTVDMTDVYPQTHWAIEGRPPGYHTPDEDVYLQGRNIVLLGKAGIFCATKGIHRLVLGTLDHNPFPDATPAFRSALASALSLGLAHDLEIGAPFATVSKAEVIRRGALLGLPLELTLSCMNPPGPISQSDQPEKLREAAWHCGLCSKCRERHDAFLEAKIPDQTAYVDSRFVSEK